MSTPYNLRQILLYNSTDVWNTINPILLLGEIGFESTIDGIRIKIGDGIHHWLELNYINNLWTQIAGSGIDITNYIISATL